MRDAIEKRYGGTAIYVSGDLGAVEIVGDNEPDGRHVFDGKNFPVLKGNKAANFTFARTEAIGRDIARAAEEAIDKGEWSGVSSLFVRKRELRVPLDNLGYQFALGKGVLVRLPGTEGSKDPHVGSTVYVLRIGDAQIITVPGELFPEIFYGVAAHRRTDCPQADTGRPPEPAVRDLMDAKYKFIFGLSPDELGYLVPGYDFHAPTFDPDGGFKEAKDICAVPPHYHETNSASSQLAQAWACTTVELLAGNPAGDPACSHYRNQPTPTH